MVIIIMTIWTPQMIIIVMPIQTPQMMIIIKTIWAPKMIIIVMTTDSTNDHHHHDYTDLIAFEAPSLHAMLMEGQHTVW